MCTRDFKMDFRSTCLIRSTTLMVMRSHILFSYTALTLLICKFHNKKEMIPVETEPLNSIVAYNEEGGNKDCLDSSILNAYTAGSGLTNQEIKDGVNGAFGRQSSRRPSAAGESLQGKQMFKRSNSVQGAPTYTAFDRATNRRHSSYHRERRMNTFQHAAAYRNNINAGQRRSSYAANSMSRKHSRTMETVLKQKVKTHGADLEIYKPRAFAEEGDMSKASSLEAITIAGSTVHLERLEDLGSKFNILEDICADFILSQSTEEPSTYPGQDGEEYEE